VNLSCSELPPFATCTFNPARVTSRFLPQFSTLTLTVPATLAPGKYLFGVNGVSTSTTTTNTVQLSVAVPEGGSSMALPAAAMQESLAADALGGAAPTSCLSGNERLCGILRGGWQRPRWRRARRCHEERGLSELLLRRE